MFLYCIFSERRLKEFNHFLEDYTEAWNCVRESLETYGKHCFPVVLLYISFDSGIMEFWCLFICPHVETLHTQKQEWVVMCCRTAFSFYFYFFHVVLAILKELLIQNCN